MELKRGMSRLHSWISDAMALPLSDALLAQFFTMWVVREPPLCSRVLPGNLQSAESIPDCSATVWAVMQKKTPNCSLFSFSFLLFIQEVPRRKSAKKALLCSWPFCSLALCFPSPWKHLPLTAPWANVSSWKHGSLVGNFYERAESGQLICSNLLNGANGLQNPKYHNRPETRWNGPFSV